jgi:hypothetical protein
MPAPVHLLLTVPTKQHLDTPALKFPKKKSDGKEEKFMAVEEIICFPGKDLPEGRINNE